MIAVVLRGIVHRRLRSLLTALAVVLGVALVSGTLMLTDSVEKAFSSILTRSYEQTDAVITAMGEPGADQAVSAALLRQVRALPQVDEAHATLIDLSGGASDPTTLVDKSGRRIDDGGPTFGFGIDPDAERFNPLELVDGRWAARDGEVAIDEETAARHDFAVGDRIRVMTRSPAEWFTIVGTARFGAGVATAGGASIALFDVDTAKRLHQRDGFYTIAVAARDGVTAERLVAEIRQLLPAGATVRTGALQAAEDAEEASFVAYIRFFLLAFGAIALLVGAFVIVNTFSITVAQRTRELATLRMLGASRRQVRASVLMEGVALGVVASVVGLAAGVLLAKGLGAVLDGLGLDLPESELVLRPRTAVVSLAAGIGVTSLAALIPAVRATRVAPLAAVRTARGSDRPPRGARRRALAMLLVGVAALGASVAVDASSPAGPLLLLLGGVAAAAGTMLSAARLAPPLVSLAARPLAALAGPVARLARDNALRDPYRTGSTAATMVVGLAVATFAGVVADAVVGSGESAFRDQIRGDLVVESPGWGVRGDIAATLTAAPGSTAATTIRTTIGGATIADSGPGLEHGGMVGVSGVDPRSITRLYRFRWTSGTDAAAARLGEDGSLVDSTVARAAGVGVGDPLVVRTRDGAAIETTVRAIFAARGTDSLVGQVVVSQALFARSFPSDGPSLTLVRTDDPAAVERALRAFPALVALTPAELAEERHGDLISILKLLYVLLGFAVVVSLLGMVNTLVLAVLERTREIGILRAIGMTRAQVRRMVRHEAILIATLAAALGIPLGAAVAGAVVHSAGYDVSSLAIPVGPLVVPAALTLVVGVVAAVLPARRASRLDVLRALQPE